jgi:hypothetical protein
MFRDIVGGRTELNPVERRPAKKAPHVNAGLLMQTFI